MAASKSKLDSPCEIPGTGAAPGTGWGLEAVNEGYLAAFNRVTAAKGWRASAKGFLLCELPARSERRGEEEGVRGGPIGTSNGDEENGSVAEGKSLGLYTC